MAVGHELRALRLRTRAGLFALLLLLRVGRNHDAAGGGNELGADDEQNRRRGRRGPVQHGLR